MNCSILTRQHGWRVCRRKTVIGHLDREQEETRSFLLLLLPHQNSNPIFEWNCAKTRVYTQGLTGSEMRSRSMHAHVPMIQPNCSCAQRMGSELRGSAGPLCRSIHIRTEKNTKVQCIHNDIEGEDPLPPMLFERHCGPHENALS